MFKQRVVFVHGAGSFGAAAWPRQHGVALSYDALFLRRHGFDTVAEPTASSFEEDTRILLDSLGDDGRGSAGGHRPHDSPEGDRIIRSFISDSSRVQARAS